MANQMKNDPNQKQSQQGAPQNTRDMPSSGNSPKTARVTTGTDERMSEGSDVESSGSGTATQRASQNSGTNGDPSRMPAKARD